MPKPIALLVCALSTWALGGCFLFGPGQAKAPPSGQQTQIVPPATDDHEHSSSLAEGDGSQIPATGTSELPSPAPSQAPFAPPADPLAQIEKAGLAKVKDDNFFNYPLHLKFHVSVFKDGQPVTVPGGLGIVNGWGIASMHTHDANGVVFVVDETSRDVRLGQFFTLWGVDLAGAAVYVNGQPVDDPAGLVLSDRAEIAVVYGTPPETIPSSHPF